VEEATKKAAELRAKNASNVVAKAKHGATISLGFFGFGQMDDDESTSQSSSAAPKGVPTLSRWRQNRDGSITGLISGSNSFDDGESVTTSPISTKDPDGGSVVKTGSGSTYVYSSLTILHVIWHGRENLTSCHFYNCRYYLEAEGGRAAPKVASDDAQAKAKELAEEKKAAAAAAAEARKKQAEQIQATAEAKKRETEEARQADIASRKEAEAKKRAISLEAAAASDARQREVAETKRREAEEKRQDAIAAVEARKREAEEKKADAAAAAEAKRQSEAKKADTFIAQAKPRSTISLGFLGFGQSDDEPKDAPRTVSSAPRGVPTLSNWRQNRDGSITGLISGK